MDAKKAPKVTPTLADGWSRLEATGWLASCGVKVRHALRSIARLRHFQAGDYLYRAGDEANGVFGVVNGAIDALIPRLDGQEIVVHRAGSGFWVGDLALFAHLERLISLRAAARLCAVQLPQGKLAALIEREPRLLADFYRLTHMNVATTLTLLGNLAIPAAEHRVALRLLIQRRLQADDDDWIRMDQKSLAELVALSAQSVRRSLRRLEGEGLVETAYRRIRITDRARLARLCGYDTRSGN